MLDLLFKRRSIRKFSDHTVAADQMDRILQAALLAPSSKSKYPCEFIVVDNKEINEKLSECKPHGASFLKNTPISVVVAGDIEKSDVWIEDCSIAASLILLQAEKEGLGACWIQVRERPHDETCTAETYIQNLLHLPVNLKVLAIVAIGHKDGEKPSRDKSFLMRDKIHFNRF